jgi:hypothetical protein
MTTNILWIPAGQWCQHPVDYQVIDGLFIAGPLVAQSLEELKVLFQEPVRIGPFRYRRHGVPAGETIHGYHRLTCSDSWVPALWHYMGIPEVLPWAIETNYHKFPAATPQEAFWLWARHARAGLIQQVSDNLSRLTLLQGIPWPEPPDGV